MHSTAARVTSDAELMQVDLEEKPQRKLVCLFDAKLEVLARLRERLADDEVRHREQLAEKEQLQGKLRLSMQEHEKTLAAEKSLFTAMLEETRTLYEKKLEKLTSALSESKRVADERAERVLALEQEKFLQGKGLSLARAENIEMFESLKLQVDAAENALRKLSAGHDAACADAQRLREALEEGLNRLFTVEKEQLSARRREVRLTERLKSLGEETELVKFENEHMVCLLESKEAEVRELRVVLAENEKLLEKFRTKYATATEKIERILGELQCSLEKFPPPASFEALRGELEALREDNVQLVKRNLLLEESLKLSARCSQEREKERPLQSMPRVEAAFSKSVAEMIARVEQALGRADALAQELSRANEFGQKQQARADELAAENVQLKQILQKLDRDEESEKDIGQADCTICGQRILSNEIANNCKRCLKTIHKKCFGKRYTSLLCGKCVS